MQCGYMAMDPIELGLRINASTHIKGFEYLHQ